MKEFHTRENSNNGIKVPLFLPDGKATKHHLMIRGIDSDAFRRAETQAKRKASTLGMIEDINKRAEEIREIEIECIASLILSWTFEEECTEANVVNFLREAPQIADLVNQLATKRSLFIAKKPTSSTSGRKQKSSSKRAPKVQK
jgi:hypothetical protein